MKRLALAIAAIGALSGCGSTGESTGAASNATAPTLKSASGTPVGSIGVLKNNFFDNYPESCDGWSLTGTSSDFLTYGECKGNDTYFWLFSDTAQRDALVDEIREKKLPLLVSDEWIIASPMDLKPAQEDIGGAINQP